ncbi:hypothetical protein EDB92DRAFT_962793 [Lactarius akahatsu]|uniref:Uncharacterized protein n=1 Tax=Lactarius akahatsu TaxID=416441 RepID=A0AAD4QH92_9AGAM|nr:hypothetical protein EDB92DRAFT_962793 [Lactarius akahatsu]
MVSHPSEPVLLKEFVASQARYAKARVNEGWAIRASWGISTPEKEKMRLHRDQPSAGFETPVLQPRATKTQVEPRPKPTSSPRPKASRSPKRDKRVKAVSVFVEHVSPKQQKRQNDKSAEKQLRASKSSRKRGHPRSDTDEEHVARLADRRERKREKREIMNPREKPRMTTRKERKDNATSGPTNKKKQKISAGFALMHGFSSANVGKSRLTVEPPLNFGVFNKGRASEKVKVDERKRSKDKGGFPSRIFSEDRFLNPRPLKQLAKQPAEHASRSEHSDTMSSRSPSHESSSLIKSKRSSTVQLRRTPIKIKGTLNRRQPSIHTQCENEEMGGSARSKTGAKLTPQAKLGKPGPSAQSVSWIIEKDSSLPSTSSEIAIISAKSKTETAVLDVRNALWGKILEDNLLVSKALSPLKTSKDPPTASFLPTMSTTREIAPKVPPENDEPATIGPWESASQVARSVLHPPDPRFTHSKFFPFPHADKSGSAEHTTHIAPPDRSKDFGSARSDSDANPSLDEPLVRKSVSLDCRREDQSPRATILSALANASSGDDTPAFPAERTSVLQASSLDSVDRALLILGAPEAVHFPYRHSQVRRRSILQQEFDPTQEDLELYQCGLELVDSNCEVPPHHLHPDGSEEIEGTSGHSRSPDTPGTLRNTQRRSLDFQGEYQVGGLETYSEEAVRRYEDHPSAVFNSPGYANDMVYTLPSSSYERQNEAVLFTTEGDTGYEIDMDSMSEAIENFSAQPEDDEDTRTGIHLWDDAAWPRGELTNVQRVEQDVAKRLKGHWFPYKF